MSKKNKNKALPTWDRAFSVEEGGYTHDDYEDVDLTVDLDPITITASLPKLSSRADYRMLERYAKAYRRGKINREQIPFKFRPYLAKTQEEQQQRAYEMFAEEEAAKELSNELGWDKLEKAYGLGMSTVVAAPTITSIAGDALTGETAKAVYHTAKKAGKRVAQEAKEIWSMAKELTAPQIGNFLLSMTGASLLGMEGNEYAQSKGYASFEDMMHESWFGGDPLSNSFKGDLARFGYGFLRPDVILGVGFGSIGSNLAKSLLKGVPDPVEKLMQQGAGKLFKQSLETSPKEQSKVGQTLARARQGISDWTQKVQDATRKKIDEISKQDWIDYFRWTESGAVRKRRKRVEELIRKEDDLAAELIRNVESKYGLGKQRLTHYNPLHSNNVEYLQRYFTDKMRMERTSVTRLSDTEIEVKFDPSELRYFTGTRPGVSTADPKLTLPEGVTLSRQIPNAESLTSASFILKYPTKKSSKPVITVDLKVSKPSKLSADAEYWMLPEEFRAAIKKEMDYTRSIINGFTENGKPDPLVKTFGSSVSSSEGFLPHISDDVDYIVARSFYDKNIKGKVPEYPGKRTRGGKAHAYDKDGELKKLDIVIIDDAPNGKADPNQPVAIQLFSKIDPIAYNNMLKKHAIDPERYPYHISYTADELVSQYDPTVGNIIDTFTAAVDKTKHLGRSYILLERAPIDKLEQAIAIVGKMKYAEGYTPLDPTLFDLTDVERNLNFLQMIGFGAENPQKLASSPRRMALIMEEYNQYASGLYRGDGELKINPKTSTLQDKIEQLAVQATEWLPEGRNVRGTGKNYVRPGNSGYGPYYSARQADTNKYFQEPGKTYYPDDLVNFYNSLDTKIMPDELRSKLVNALTTVAKKYGTSLDSIDQTPEALHEAITSTYIKLSEQARQQLLQELDNIVPFLESTTYSMEAYRGAFKPNKKGAYFLNEDPYPFEIIGSSDYRYSSFRLRERPPLDIEATKHALQQDIVSLKKRPDKYTKKEKAIIETYNDREIASQNAKTRMDKLIDESYRLIDKQNRITQGIHIAKKTAFVGAGGALLTFLAHTLISLARNKRSKELKEKIGNTETIDNYEQER